MKELRDSWIDILMILSDRKGHPLWELTKQVKREKGNLKLTLELLEVGLPEGHWNFGFKWWDFRNIAEFDAKLHEAKDPLSRLILDKTNSLFGKVVGGGPIMHLHSLNELLNDESLFDGDHFSHIELSATARKMVNKDLNWADLRRFNRIILEEAYPNDIYGTQNFIIYKGSPRKTTRPRSKHPKAIEIPYYLTEDLYVFDFILINMDRLLERLNPDNTMTAPIVPIIPDDAKDFFREKDDSHEEYIKLWNKAEACNRKEIKRNFKRANNFIYSNYTQRIPINLH